VDGSAGIASIAAVSGANTIQASGQYAISMSSDPEDMLVFAGGSGTVATGQGQNTVVGDGSGTGNLILSQGTDDWIVARSGSTLSRLPVPGTSFSGASATWMSSTQATAARSPALAPIARSVRPAPMR
jgi:hypothetical protein